MHPIVAAWKSFSAARVCAPSRPIVAPFHANRCASSYPTVAPLHANRRAGSRPTCQLGLISVSTFTGFWNSALESHPWPRHTV
eukprot:1784499-Rhodomonas_salina.2